MSDKLVFSSFFQGGGGQLSKILFTMAAAVAVVGSVSATDYYWWRLGNNELGLWSDPANWGVTNSASGGKVSYDAVEGTLTAAQHAPANNDVLEPGFTQGRTLYADLEDKTVILGNWKVGDWPDARTMRLTNGTLRIAQKASFRRCWFTMETNSTLVLEKGCTASDGDGATSGFTIRNGGKVIFPVGSTFSNYKSTITIDEGGEFQLAGVLSQYGGAQESVWTNSGTLDLPHGIALAPNHASGETLTIVNTGTGRIELGGDLTNADSPSKMKIRLQGGTVAASANATISAKQEFKITNANTFEVADGATLSIVGATWQAGSSAVKTGNGTLQLDATVPIRIEEGAVMFADAFTSVEFAGGALVLLADANGVQTAPAALTVEAGAKARIRIDGAVLLPSGTYQIVAAGCELGADDYIVDCGSQIATSVAVNADGSLSLTVLGVSENARASVWNPQSANAVWSSADAWLTDNADDDGQTQGAFLNDAVARFTGTEEIAVPTVMIDDAVRAAAVQVSGSRDYTLEGGREGSLDVREVVKDGSGRLTLNVGGLAGAAFTLKGGSLAFGPTTRQVAAAGVPVAVPANASVDVRSCEIVPDVLGLIQFCYGPDSIDYQTATDFPVTNKVDSISAQMVASPKAPDGTSLSGKAVWVSGWFKVEESEAGEWTFQGRYDDNIRFIVDSTVLFNTTSYTDTQTASISLDAGWHSFEARMRDGSGGWGYDGWLKVRKYGEENYQKFTENSMNFNWRGTAVDPYLMPVVKMVLTAGENSEICFGSENFVLASGSVIDETASLSIDIHAVPANRTFLACEDAALLPVVKAKLQTTLGDAGDIVETEDGLAWEMNAVFSSTTVTDLDDAIGWMNGVAPREDEHVTVTGVGTHPVMTAETTGFAEITLTGGAALTINATREINELTLAAGTTLQIAAAEGAATVTATGAFATTGSGTVTIDVAEGCVLDLSGVEVSTAAKIVKTGAGVIVFDAVAVKIDVQTGAVAFPLDVPCDLSQVTLQEGASYQALTESGLEAAVATPVPDSSLVALYSAGCYRGVGTWATTANWIGGMPTANNRVRVMGDGSSLTVDDADTVMPLSISVDDGAMLVVIADVTLPPVTLASAATLAIGDNETKPACTVVMSEAPDATAAVVDDVVTLPTVSIAKNVTVKFSGSAWFRNVNLDLCGKLTTTANNIGSFRFGYAEAGETAYFRMRANGAEIRPLSNQQQDTATIDFVRPASGGRVKVPDGIVLTNCSFPTSDWVEYNNCYVGKNNPVDEAFTLEISGGTFNLHNKLFVSGGAEVKVKDGGKIYWTLNHPNQGDSTVSGRASIEVSGEGTVLDLSASISRYNFKPDESGFEVLRLTDGGTIHTCVLTSGNNNGVVRVADGVAVVIKKSTAGNRFDIADYTSMELFKGFKGVNILDGKSLTVVGRDVDGGYGLVNAPWDRVVTISQPVTGGGNLVVRNEVVANSMDVIIKNSANGCTGRALSEGANNARLLFDNGANWAGTVVAGSVGLVNTAADAPTCATFGALDLAGNFPIRYWKDGEGTVTCDRIDLGAIVANGGRITFEAQDGATIAAHDRLVIGSLPKSAANSLPKVMKGWRVKAVDDPADDSRVLLRADTMVGFMVIFK